MKRLTAWTIDIVTDPAPNPAGADPAADTAPRPVFLVTGTDAYSGVAVELTVSTPIRYTGAPITVIDRAAVEWELAL